MAKKKIRKFLKKALPLAALGLGAMGLARRRATQQVADVLRGQRPTALQNPAVTSKLEMLQAMPANEPKL